MVVSTISKGNHHFPLQNSDLIRKMILWIDLVGFLGLYTNPGTHPNRFGASGGMGFRSVKPLDDSHQKHPAIRGVACDPRTSLDHSKTTVWII